LKVCTWCLRPPSSQHEERVGDDRPGDGGLHQRVLPRRQRRERDHELGQVAERGVDETARRIACPFGHRFRREAQERRERNDGKNGQKEEQRVRVGPHHLDGEDRRDEDEEPEERRLGDLAEKDGHGRPI
jgi:hypothetical protein